MSVIWSWSGLSDQILFGETFQTGTGQTGTMALDTTGKYVMTNAKSLKYNQVTSAFGGTVYNVIYLPREHVAKRLRATWVFMNDNDDADLDHILFVYRVFNGTHYEDYAMRWTSAFGGTEEIQYKNSSGVFTNTGWSYPTDMGGDERWFELSYDNDLTNQKITFMRLNEQVLQTDAPVHTVSDTSFPTSLMLLQLSGVDTEIAVYVDSFTLEDISL